MEIFDISNFVVIIFWKDLLLIQLSIYKLASGSSILQCCTNAAMPMECLDVCRDEKVCFGEEKEAALVLMDVSMCKASVGILKKCCEGTFRL